MAALQVGNLPQELDDDLERRTAGNPIARNREQAAASGHVPEGAVDVTQLIRDMREERTDHIMQVLQGTAQEGEPR